MYGNGWTRLCAVLTVTLVMLTSGCAATTGSGTDAVCDALCPVLPSYSTRDTDQTKFEGAKFLDAFEAACG